MVLNCTTNPTLISRKQAAAILGCTDKFLDDHAIQLGKQGQGRSVRYNFELVLQTHAQRNVNTLTELDSFWNQPKDFLRSDYFSSREVADLLRRDIANIPLRFYTLPGVFRDEKGAWLFPKMEIEFQKDILQNGNWLSRRGLAKFLGISAATLKDAENREELQKNAVGVKGFIEYSIEQALKFVADHYPARFADYLKCMSKQKDVSQDLSDKFSILAEQTRAMLEGRSHFKTLEMGKVLGLANPYSLLASEKIALGAVSRGRDIYYPKDVIYKEWFRVEIERLNKTTQESVSNHGAEALAKILLAFGPQTAYQLVQEPSVRTSTALTIGVILAETHLQFLDTRDALQSESKCRSTLLKGLGSGHFSQDDLSSWAKNLRALKDNLPNLNKEDRVLEQSLLVQIIAVETRLKAGGNIR